MKVCYIDIKKKTAKMSITMKEFCAYEAADKNLGPNQTKFINADHLEKALLTSLSRYHVGVDELAEIMEEIENFSESR